MVAQKIGCFEVTELSPGRWRVVNTLTTFEYVTYGSEDDVRAGLENQSAQWEKRFAEMGPRPPMARGQRSKEKWKNRTLAPIKKSPFVPAKPSE